MKDLFRKSIFFYSLGSCCLLGWTTAARADNPEIYSLGPHFRREALLKPRSKPMLPALDAQAYVLIDANSGQILASRNIEQRLAPASLTKMMTTYLIFSALSSDRVQLLESVTISQTGGAMEGSRMFVVPGTCVSIEDLLKGVIVQSGNDASVALAERCAGSEAGFADLMNQQAQQLHMRATHFANASGIPHTEHYTTALDMAMLARAIILDFPQYYPWYSQKSFTHNHIKQTNRNRLLWQDPSVDGIKTGDTGEAGYCLAASAQREGMRLIAVIMGAPSDKARMHTAQALLNYGFRFFETRRIYAAEKPIAQSTVWFGQRWTVPIGLEQDLYVTTLRGYSTDIKTQIRLRKFLRAPLAIKEPIGTLEVKLNNETLAIIPLVTQAAVPEGFWLKRKIDQLVNGFSVRY